MIFKKGGRERIERISKSSNSRNGHVVHMIQSSGGSKTVVRHRGEKKI